MLRKNFNSLSSPKKHIIRLLLLAAVAVLCLFWRCPTRYLFGICCPGCGMTRALFCALRLDFKTAFYYHPLFWLVPPIFLYLVHRRILPKKPSEKAEIAVAAVIVVIYIAVYIYRLAANDPVIYVDFSKALINKWR